jgi:hypothetical protein
MKTSTGYELRLQDVTSLLNGASRWHRKQIATLANVAIRKNGEGFQYFDKAGREISLSEVHRRSQADPKIRRRLYNLWMFYSR